MGALLYDVYVDTCFATYVVLWFATMLLAQANEEWMGKMDKTEKYTVAGLCFGGSGVFLCEDAVVCARVYGYCDGTVVEFCMGIACIVIATVSLYIAGMLRDRRIQAEFDRRRAERERRRAERKNRGW